MEMNKYYKKNPLWDYLGPAIVGTVFWGALAYMGLSNCNGEPQNLVKTPIKKESKLCEIAKSNGVVRDEKNENTQLILKRDTYTPQSTIGDLYLDRNNNGHIDKDDEYLCHTLEPSWKNNQQNISCIPEGNYPVNKRESAHYGLHYKIKSVQNRNNILIHAGNFPKNTSGCILVGNKKRDNYVSESKVTLKNLRKRFEGYKNMQLKIINKRG